MKHRIWLLEALRLHFEDNLSRVEAVRRQGIPKSTACDLFVRFRKAGLSWPLPSTLSEQKLDECLYRQYAITTVVPEVMAETSAVRKRNRRANFPQEFKIALV